MEHILLGTTLRHMEDRKMIEDRQHCFKKCKSCLIKLLAFYNSVTELVDEGGAIIVIYPDLCKVFDTILYNILISKMERRGFDEWTVWWIRN